MLTFSTGCLTVLFTRCAYAFLFAVSKAESFVVVLKSDDVKVFIITLITSLAKEVMF